MTIDQLPRASWRLPARALRAATHWPVASQQVARRNALVSSTALASRRQELADVEEFLARHTARHTARHSARHSARQTARQTARGTARHSA